MRAYIIRRLLLIIPTLFILSILVFLSVRFIPGDAIDAMLGKPEFISGEVDRPALEHMLGLDVPVHVQYGRWIGGIFRHGSLGHSLLGSRRAVEEKIIDRLPVTIELGVMAILIGLAIALPVGIYSAMRQDTAADYLGRSVAIIGLATPNFWLATMVVLYPSLWWAWSPPMEWVPFSEDPLGNLGMFLIPSVILGTALAAATMRMSRTMMLEVLRQDYIRTAWAKGLNERVVIMRHAVKNALIPGCDPDRPAVADPGRWLRHHGEHIQPAGAGSSPADCPRRQRLPGGLRSKPGFRHRGCRGQSNDRPDLSVLRPQGPIQLKGGYERRHRDTISSNCAKETFPAG